MKENDGSSITIIPESIPQGTTLDEEKKLWTFSQRWADLNVADMIHTTKGFQTYYISGRKYKRILNRHILLNSNKIKPVD